MLHAQGPQLSFPSSQTKLKMGYMLAFDIVHYCFHYTLNIWMIKISSTHLLLFINNCILFLNVGNVKLQLASVLHSLCLSGSAALANILLCFKVFGSTVSLNKDRDIWDGKLFIPYAFQSSHCYKLPYLGFIKSVKNIILCYIKLCDLFRRNHIFESMRVNL